MLPDYLASSRRVFAGKRIDVHRLELPGGVVREVVVHPGAVVILPMLDDRTVAMIRNRRPAVDAELWELPAGTLEPDEPPEQCAGRELIEETGYRAERIEHMTEFFTTPGFCNERIIAYLATGLEHVGQDLDPNEQITVEPVDLDRLIEMIRRGQVHDAKTMAVLLYYHALVREGA